jgi:hypothetical protein
VTNERKNGRGIMVGGTKIYIGKEYERDWM